MTVTVRILQHGSALNTILAGNATKFRRWRELPEGNAVVDQIEQIAEDRRVELNG